MSARLPFGKYRGRELDQVPMSYLAWLYDECDLREPLRTEVADELRFRLDLDDASLALAPRPPEDLAPVVAEIITTGFRLLSQRTHPDHGGGDHARMQRLNGARSWCRSAGLAR